MEKIVVIEEASFFPMNHPSVAPTPKMDSVQQTARVEVTSNHWNTKGMRVVPYKVGGMAVHSREGFN